MQLRRIIVPLKGMSVDADVIRIAVALAKPVKAEIIAIHVIMPSGIGVTAIRTMVAIVSSAQGPRNASSMASILAWHIETELLQASEAAAAIIDTARERQADLIVLGMPYRKRLGRVYVGPTVEDVYKGAHCAVLAYRQEEVG